MLTRRMKIFYAVLGLILLGVVRESLWVRPRFGLSQQAHLGLSKVPGSIEIKFVSNKMWTCRIENGEMGNVKEYEFGGLERKPFIHLKQDIPQGLPTVEGFQYYGPYQVSPDKSRMLFSLSPEKDWWLPSSFVVLRASDKKKLLYGKTEEYVEDVAWSRDSSMFIMLEMPCRRSFSVMGLIGGFFGHPQDVCASYISIYDLNGNRLLRTGVASGLILPSAQISWTN
jgi:hypothetical protein